MKEIVFLGCFTLILALHSAEKIIENSRLKKELEEVKSQCSYLEQELERAEISVLKN